MSAFSLFFSASFNNLKAKSQVKNKTIGAECTEQWCTLALLVAMGHGLYGDVVQLCGGSDLGKIEDDEVTDARASV